MGFEEVMSQYSAEYEDCAACEGVGKRYYLECPACAGKGKIRRKIRYGINITSWRGGMGRAIHFYGKAWRLNSAAPRGNRGSELYDIPAKDDSHYYLYEFPVEYILTKSQAAAMNRHDKGYQSVMAKWSAGDPTNRFEHKEDVLSVGIEWLTGCFGNDIDIEIGDHIALDSYAITVLNVREYAAKLRELTKNVERGELDYFPLDPFVSMRAKMSGELVLCAAHEKRLEELYG